MTAIPKPKTTRHALVFLAVALALIAMVSAVSAAQQTWYLSSTPSTIGYDYNMYYGSNSGGGDDRSFSNGDVYYWISDEAALYDLTFPSGTWTLYTRKTGGFGVNFRWRIGVWDPDIGANGDFTNWTAWEAENSLSTTFQSFTSTRSITVYEGQYLALQIESTSVFSFTLDIATGTAGTYLRSPDVSFNYPYPELSTFLLMSVGLIALVGYVGYRRRSCQ